MPQVHSVHDAESRELHRAAQETSAGKRDSAMYKKSSSPTEYRDMISHS